MSTETMSHLTQKMTKIDQEEPLGQQRNTSIALLKLMDIAERDIKAGNTLSVQQAK